MIVSEFKSRSDLIRAKLTFGHTVHWPIFHASQIPRKPLRPFTCTISLTPSADPVWPLLPRMAVWIVVIMAVVGNVVVLVVLIDRNFKLTTPKFLMGNLAFADLCMGLYLLIIASMDVHTIGVYFSYAIDWQEGKLGS